MPPAAGPSRPSRRNATQPVATASPPPAGSSSVPIESPSKARAGLQLLEGPVQITLDGFTRSFKAIQSHAFVGRPVADTLLPTEGSEGAEETDELLEGAQEQIKATKLRYFAPYPHLIPLPPLSSTPPSALAPYQKVNLASTFTILQLVSVPPPPPPPPVPQPKRKRGAPSKTPATAPSVGDFDSGAREERAEMMRELRDGCWGGVMSLVAPGTKADQDYLWDGSGTQPKTKAADKLAGRGAERALVDGKEAKERRKQGWEERLEAMLEICTAAIVLSNPTTDEPIDVLADTRIAGLLRGDFLDGDDLVTRSGFKGPSGAVFKNITEKRAVATVMWKKMSIARAGNLNGLTPAEMAAKYPLEGMAQIVGAYLMARVWLPYIHNQEPPAVFSFNNPSTPGLRLTGDHFDSPGRTASPSLPPTTKTARGKKTVVPSVLAIVEAARDFVADEPDEEGMVEVGEDTSEDEQPEGTSLDEIDTGLGAHSAKPKSAVAAGKQRAVLGPDADEVEVGEDDTDDEQAVEAEVEGITVEDLAGFVGRDPADTATVPKKHQSALRKSIGKDTRVTYIAKTQATGPSIPNALVNHVDQELAKGRSPQELMDALQKAIQQASQPSTSASRPRPVDGSGSTTEEEEDRPRPPRRTEAQKKAAKKRIIGGSAHVDGVSNSEEDAAAAAEEVDEIDDSEEDEDGRPRKRVVLPPVNSYVTSSGFRYSTGGNRTGRVSWTPEEDECLLKAMKDIYPRSGIWTKVIALHGVNGVESTALKDRNIQSCKDRARNIKIQMLKARKQVPEYLSGITIPKSQQEAISKLAAQVAPGPRRNAVASGSGTRAEVPGEDEE